MNFSQTKADEIKYNKKLILHCIKQFGPISRAEICKRIQISKPTVSTFVEELIEEGWVIESSAGKTHNKSGRKPTYLHFNEQAYYALGVDIGGTKVLVAVSDLNGTILGEERFDTAPFLERNFLKKLQTTVAHLLKKTGLKPSQIIGMGIGIPGITDSHSGVVIEAPSLGWQQYPLREKAAAYFDFPIHIDNDVNVSALGEQWLGAAKKKENVILIAIGTGVGSGLIIDGKLFRGANWGQAKSAIW
ncbi:ROK family transcriptional regulator [Virgibacillus sp. 179-BFC.A HS]|uniref:ROK family transcriptional regulator n=1 Tax=Tigheibacillus jepli TaxID=3035914 RepID=A0ABU5CF38_9BACI|nr:ROK family transcriptional regulator [Virgibacillus sp. 179-BFC.A HS]MDY0404943.1 ROK family transcriptional regulator [Virgibacillus sp. 179-BFC.A HS]